MAGSAGIMGGAKPTQMAGQAPAGGKGGGSVAQQTNNVGGNVAQQANTANQMAMAGAAGEMGYQPMMIDPNQFGRAGASQVNAQIIDPNQFGRAGTSQVNAQMIDPYQSNMMAAQTSAEDIQRFMNPYTSNVVDTAMGDINRFNQMQQNQTAAQYQQAGAFGGSRAALAEAEDRRNAAQQMASTAGQLRSQGFNTALGAAQQETGLRQQAAMQNAQQQLQALLANQGAGLTASQANAANQLAASQANMNAGLQAALANQGAQLAASQTNMNAGLQAALANQGAQLGGSQQRLAAGNQLANLGNLGFGQGMQSLQNMQQQGMMQQALQQQLLNAAQGQYQGYTGFPAQSLGYYAQALGATQMPQNTTTSRQPGLFDYLTLGASIF